MMPGRKWPCEISNVFHSRSSRIGQCPEYRQTRRILGLEDMCLSGSALTRSISEPVGLPYGRGGGLSDTLTHLSRFGFLKRITVKHLLHELGFSVPL